MSKKKEVALRIREAVCARYGGFENTTAAQIKAAWDLIDPAERKTILSKKQGGADASSTGSKK